MFKISHGQRLVLASSSPRRRELLGGCGLLFDVLSPDINEESLPGELPQALVERLAREKGACVSIGQQEAWVIAADTIVVLDHTILGKPQDKRDAAQMLGALQGRWHEVWGGVAVLNHKRSVSKISSFRSEVFMQPLSASEIECYIETGEPMDKAGSYAIQGIGAALVKEVRGSYTNIVGLNLPEVIDQLKHFGVIESGVGVGSR